MLKNFSIKGIYLAIISLIALIVLVVNGGIILSSIGKKVLITDQEYLIKNNWEIKACEQGEWNEKLKENTKKTPEEIESCKKEAKNTMILRRNLEFKEMMITSIIWLLIFGGVFGYHYNVFRKQK